MDRTDMKHPGTKALLDAWTALRGERAAPFRAEVTDEALGPALAPHCFVVEAVGGQLRIRTAGAAVSAIFAMDPRGMNASGLIADGAERVSALAAACLSAGDVGVASGQMSGAETEAAGFELILAPLRSDFGRVDRLLCALHVAGEVSGGCARLRVAETRMVAQTKPKAADGPLPGFAEAAAPFAPAPKKASAGRAFLRVVK